MKNFLLKPITSRDFEEFYELLSSDFCPSERKTKERELQALKNTLFAPAYIEKEGVKVGYICLWDFDGFVFIEHLAVLKDFRGCGVGSEFLGELLVDIKKTVVLEVERPHDEISKKRIEFYTRVGFTVNPYDYVQPQYFKSAEKIPMFICSYPREIPKDEYISITNKIKNAVYG